jgi:hypothetical protein
LPSNTTSHITTPGLKQNSRAALINPSTRRGFQ